MWRLKACLLIFIFNNRNILSFRHIIEIFCALNYCTFRFSAKYMRYFTYKNVTISEGCNNVTINIQNAHYWNLLDTVWVRILQRERGVLSFRVLWVLLLGRYCGFWRRFWRHRCYSPLSHVRHVYNVVGYQMCVL